MLLVGDALPPSDRMTVRGGGFLLNASNETSINKLSPCAPRFNNLRFIVPAKVVAPRA